jgi:Zn-dependent protease/CBS domain-containing protein
MNGTIRIGNLFGIPFSVHPSWFLVLGLVTWSYGSGLAAQFPTLGAGLPWLLGLGAALLLFASVLAHELGHSFVALRQGIGVKSINLFFFGGLASLERESKTPASAFWVAIAGPLVSLIIFGFLTALRLGTGVSGPLAAILQLLASVNLILALFNLIPGLPLDGGNILKALVWKITGNPYKGVTFASRAGQFLGWLAIGSALIPLLLFGSFAGFWNGLLGWFLLQNAGRAAQSATVQEIMSDLTAADAVIPNSPMVSGDLSLREFADQLILGNSQWQRFLVTNAEGQLVGAIAVDDLKAVPSDRWATTKVQELTQSIEQTILIEADQPLLEVVTLLEEKKLPALPVLRGNGVLVGILEKASVMELLRSKAEAHPA